MFMKGCLKIKKKRIKREEERRGKEAHEHTKTPWLG